MYETIVGVVHKIEPIKDDKKGHAVLASEQAIDQAWSLAVKKLGIMGYGEDFIVNLMQTGQMIAYDVPLDHPSRSKENDVARGWIGAMLNGELKLLSSYAVRQNYRNTR